jgi:hypothetical protein
MKKLLVAVLGMGLLALVSGCATMKTDQGGNAVDIAKAKYQQDVTFVAFEMKGVNEIKGSNICIVARSYRPPISVVPEPGIMDKLCDAAKWVAGFYFGSKMLDSVADQRIVRPEVVNPEVVVVGP